MFPQTHRKEGCLESFNSLILFFRKHNLVIDLTLSRTFIQLIPLNILTKWLCLYVLKGWQTIILQFTNYRGYLGFFCNDFDPFHLHLSQINILLYNDNNIVILNPWTTSLKTCPTLSVSAFCDISHVPDAFVQTYSNSYIHRWWL